MPFLDCRLRIFNQLEEHRENKEGPQRMLLLSLIALTTMHITSTAANNPVSSQFTVYFTTKLTPTFNIKVNFTSRGTPVSLQMQPEFNIKAICTSMHQLCVRDHEDFSAFMLIKADDILAWKQLSTYTHSSNCLKNLLK